MATLAQMIEAEMKVKVLLDQEHAKTGRSSLRRTQLDLDWGCLQAKTCLIVDIDKEEN